ncbi:hypothetical protein FJW06_15515 [Mesorhizobium sp. B4-1-3]|uniref:hypothetical protein n=1 Tax=Mesorhizobium sp. B4-1-3 TaxID=2589889 RepID=UPI00112E0B12|nr:hypothetical protein [Mesorhizobium sp. B4-1-3]TPI13058.1 hypothetical protein FJW06_15515 [Mesorhizobium sp. B4-1-3]
MRSQLFGGAALLFSISVAAANPVTEIGGDAPAAQLALTNPAEYAWQVFLFVNHPALSGVAGKADGALNLGDATDKSVVWETWAQESGQRTNTSEVYLPKGVKPSEWKDLKRGGGARLLSLDPSAERAAFLAAGNPFGQITPFFVEGEALSQEVRINEAGFTFIRDQGMFSKEGLEALYKAARAATPKRESISFPAGTKEIKAQWLPIKDADKGRYLWRTARVDGKDVTYGLVSLHIITKDLPMWVWIDFGHRDCEEAKGACDNGWLAQNLTPKQQKALLPQEPALTTPVDPTVPTGSVRPEVKGTVWENYLLRGVQTAYTTQYGLPTVLSNPVIENGFQNSSCMSCHSRASVGPHFIGNKVNALATGDPTLGPPDPALFGAGPGFGTPDLLAYLQTDFVWSAPFRAQPVDPSK